MSKRTSSMATNGDAKKADLADCTSASSPPAPQPGHHALTAVPPSPAYDKQKVLLSSEVGHFSLIRALHLADLITEMNGTSCSPPPPLPHGHHRQI